MLLLLLLLFLLSVVVVVSGNIYIYLSPLKGGRGCLMSPLCRESQGCHMISLSYLLSFFLVCLFVCFCLFPFPLPIVLLLFLSRHFSVNVHSPAIIIIMYIYHALINALSAHMIRINLNMIFYAHVKRSPTKTIYIKYYLKNILLLRVSSFFLFFCMAVVEQPGNDSW